MSAPTELVQGVPLFSGLDRRELQGVASSMKERTFNAGQVIATEGQTGIGFFVIAEGTAKVSQGDEERGTLGPGDYFGEIALIDDGLRTAWVVHALHTRITPHHKPFASGTRAVRRRQSGSASAIAMRRPKN